MNKNKVWQRIAKIKKAISHNNIEDEMWGDQIEKGEAMAKVGCLIFGHNYSVIGELYGGMSGPYITKTCKKCGFSHGDWADSFGW